MPADQTSRRAARKGCRMQSGSSFRFDNGRRRPVRRLHSRYARDRSIVYLRFTIMTTRHTESFISRCLWPTTDCERLRLATSCRGHRRSWFPCRTGYPIAFRYRLSTYSPYSLLLFAETYSDLIQIYTSTFFFNLSKGENVRIISGISAVVVNKLVFFFSNQKCRRCKNVGALTFDRSLPHSVIPCTCIHDLINIRPLVSKTGLDNRVSLVYEWNVIVIYAYYACEWNARNSHCVRGGLTVCRLL